MESQYIEFTNRSRINVIKTENNIRGRVRSIMDLKKAQATKGGKIHIAYLNSNMSLCLQYIGTEVQNIQDKNITCKKCLKAYQKIEKANK